MIRAGHRVIADHKRSYENPIQARAGDRVRVIRRDEEAPDWLWCEHPVSGLAGWTPEAFLDAIDDAQTACLRRDCAATELSVTAGETGWVPTASLSESIA